MTVMTRVMKMDTASKASPKDFQSVLDGIESVSGKIRYLTSLKWERGAIAQKLNIKYQHVRNVQLNPLKAKKA